MAKRRKLLLDTVTSAHAINLSVPFTTRPGEADVDAAERALRSLQNVTFSANVPGVGRVEVRIGDVYPDGITWDDIREAE